MISPVFALTLVLALSPLRGPQMPTGFLVKTLEYRGAPAKYVVYVPAGYDAATPMPAILFLHGRGEEGSDGWKQVAVGLGRAIMLDVERWNFIVVFPQKPEEPTHWVDHQELALAALERTRREYNVDGARIYLTGISLGGFGTWAIAARNPGLFAAIAPVCGGGSPEDARRLAGMPIWNFHGDADPVIPIERSRVMVDAVRAAGGEPRFTVYEGVGHNSWDRAYAEPELPGWLLQHRREPAAASSPSAAREP